MREKFQSNEPRGLLIKQSTISNTTMSLLIVCVCGGGGGDGGGGDGGGGEQKKKVHQIFSVCVFSCFHWGYCLSLFVWFAKYLLLNLFVSNQGTIECWMASFGHALHPCGPFYATLRTSNKSLRTNSPQQNGELRRPEDVSSGGISKNACKDFVISMRQGYATCRYIGTPWHMWCKSDSPYVSFLFECFLSLGETSISCMIWHTNFDNEIKHFCF